MITPASKDDIFEIANLVNSAYRGDDSRVGWTTEADLFDGQRTDPEKILKEINQDHQRILCYRMEEGAPILACVFLQRNENENGIFCYLGMLTVRPTEQAKGTGKYLLEESENFARNWGAKRMTLGVINLRDVLMAWYERRGYKKCGIKPFPYAGAALDLPKRSDMHFVMFEKPL